MTTTQARQQTRIPIRNLVQAAAAACVDKKGEDTRILELDPIDAGLSDFFLVTSATNNRQTVAIADEVEHRLKKEFGAFPNSIEGRRQGEWILLDYVDFVVHVFLSERRVFYNIERLRKSARPLTPAEFDAELKAALAARTITVRKQASTKPKPAGVKTPPPAPRAKRAEKKLPATGKLRSPRKAATKPAAKKKAVKV
jgi:ribosome-associated protein